ncbi:MAG: hypothetical protein ACYDDF_12485 [Thermoplasmatota archaeon]
MDEPAPAPTPLYKLYRPAKLFRSQFDQEDHARKAKPLGISPEDHAKFIHLILRREASPLDFRGLTGASLAARIQELWNRGFGTGNT